MQTETSLCRRHLVARELGIELPERFFCDRAPWHVVLCSRLGKNHLVRHGEIAWMRQMIEKANHRGDRCLIMRDTAAAPWAERACQLLGIDPIRLAIDTSEEPWQTTRVPSNFSRDQIAIALADRVDAAYIRPKGTIERLLRNRIEQDASPMIQVLLTPHSNEASKQLITAGAIGYWQNEASHAAPLALSTRPHLLTGPDPSGPVLRTDTSHRLPRARRNPAFALIEQPERWLIHSTRQRSGPWPGQSLNQFNDWLLLSSPTGAIPSPLETLQRIVGERRLVGTHRTTRCKEPVVCFTSLPIGEWLARRKYRPHLARWDCEPYGIAIDREAAKQRGFAPVIYGDCSGLAEVPDSERWRWQATGSTYDWTEEREWRAKGIVDLRSFAADDVVVFVHDEREKSLFCDCPWTVVSVQEAGVVAP